MTKLGTKLAELEASTESPTLLESVNTLAEKLKALQQEYRNHQLSIIDRTESKEELAEEQQALRQRRSDFDSQRTHSTFDDLGHTHSKV